MKKMLKAQENALQDLRSFIIYQAQKTLFQTREEKTLEQNCPIAVFSWWAARSGYLLSTNNSHLNNTL